MFKTTLHPLAFFAAEATSAAPPRNRFPRESTRDDARLDIPATGASRRFRFFGR